MAKMTTKTRAFTLVELLVVMLILAVLAAILFPIIQAAKGVPKRSVCLSNQKQIGMATLIYLGDFDDRFPQCRRTSAHPEKDDADGSMDEPDYGSFFRKVHPYTKSGATPEGPIEIGLYRCPDDRDPFGNACLQENPDTPDLTSYVVNAGFLFGLKSTDVVQPSETILLAERRSAETAAGSFCDYAYHPWFRKGNPSAPEDQMDAELGAIATKRHNTTSNFLLADGHTNTYRWEWTFSPPKLDMHSIGRE